MVRLTIFTMKRFFLFFTLLALLSSCGKDDEPKPEPTPNPPSQNDPDDPDDPDNENINITLAPTTLSFEAQGGTLDLTVTCTTGKTWTLSGGESWCTASGTNGSNGATVTFTAEANTSPDERNATYTFTCGDKTAKLVVTQKQQTVTTVHVPTKGTLASVLAENDLEASSIVLLKITGEINDVDILTIQEMTNLMNLDISGINLTELPGSAFFGLKNLKKVVLPNILTSIGERALPKNLQSIEIPASVETIGNNAFASCKNLTIVTFEKGSQLKTIGYSAFSNCTSLTSIEIPASVETIEDDAFYACKALTIVTFEKGSQLKTIESAAFQATALQSIEIPASVETIEERAFEKCTALTTVTFEQGSRLKTIQGSISYLNSDGLSYTYYHGAFYNLPNLKTVDMSACTQVETIKVCAFGMCNIQVFKIGTIEPPKAQYSSVSTAAFSILKVPAESVEAYKKAEEWQRFSSISALD